MLRTLFPKKGIAVPLSTEHTLVLIKLLFLFPCELRFFLSLIQQEPSLAPMITQDMVLTPL